MSHPDLSHPAPAYRGEEGLVNASLQRADAPPDILAMDDAKRAAFYLRHDTFWAPETDG